ncbi:MAG: ferritin family protein, partial [bacterium]
MVKHKMTQQNLESAYAGESQAHMKYLIFSEVAEREGKP